MISLKNTILVFDKKYIDLRKVNVERISFEVYKRNNKFRILMFDENKNLICDIKDIKRVLNFSMFPNDKLEFKKLIDQNYSKIEYMKREEKEKAAEYIKTLEKVSLENKYIITNHNSFINLKNLEVHDLKIGLTSHKYIISAVLAKQNGQVICSFKDIRKLVENPVDGIDTSNSTQIWTVYFDNKVGITKWNNENKKIYVEVINENRESVEIIDFETIKNNINKAEIEQPYTGNVWKKKLFFVKSEFGKYSFAKSKRQK